MRSLALLLALVGAPPAAAQQVVTSRAAERVEVTVYRDSSRGDEPFDLGWLNGYALISETRHVRLPAGLSELRFEGVTGGIVPQSAIVTGLGEAVLEKNRDARLLSPGSLLDASLGERLHLRRTSKATGKVTEEDAVVRATNDGIVVQTAAGVEALRCSGLPETLLADGVPVGLSAKPTLSVLVRSPGPVEREVRLSYISNNFDWQADYVADLNDRGDALSLFGWLTIANGDQTSLADAATNAVAGTLNRNRVWVDPGRADPVRIECWPQGTTSDIPEDVFDIVVTGSSAAYAKAPPPPPPPPPAPERGGAEDYQAIEERLGDVRLYRVPIAVTVAGKSQKQIAMIRQPAVAVQAALRLRAFGGHIDQPLERVLISRNRPQEGLGLAIPAGKVTLYGRRDGHRVLVGEGRMRDYAVGEKVEIAVGMAAGVRARQTPSAAKDGGGFQLTLTNDLSVPQWVEVELPLGAKAPGARLVKRDGWMLWRVRVPANGTAELRWRID